MKALLDELDAVVADAKRRQIPIVVIGACALRTYLPAPEKRVSADADVLTTADAVEKLAALLEERGYHAYTIGPWRRAERTSPDRTVIDVAVDAIVDLRSYQSYAIDWNTVSSRSEPGRLPIPVPRIEDLVAQKLIAAREKDLLDVVLVASEPALVVRGEVLRREMEEQDIEIPVTRGCLEAVAAVSSGRMAELWRERYGEEVSAELLTEAIQRLRRWVEQGA